MILDTNAVSAFATGDSALANVLGDVAPHHLPIIVVGEYGFGLAGSGRAELRGWFSRLISESIVLPADLETATRYSSVCAQLKRDGRPIPTNDIWIAALGIQHGLPVISRDKHFDAVSGLKRVSW